MTEAEELAEALAVANNDHVAIEEQVEGVFPDWKALVKTSTFRGWVSYQPAEVQRLMDSAYATDAIECLTLFKLWLDSLAASPEQQSRYGQEFAEIRHRMRAQKDRTYLFGGGWAHFGS